MDLMGLMGQLRVISSLLCTMTIPIFSSLWNMTCEVELEVQVDSTASLGMAELEAEVGDRTPGNFAWGYYSIIADSEQG
jgi:hypothetical protein